MEKIVGSATSSVLIIVFQGKGFSPKEELGRDPLSPLLSVLAADLL